MTARLLFPARIRNQAANALSCCSEDVNINAREKTPVPGVPAVRPFSLRLLKDSRG